MKLSFMLHVSLRMRAQSDAQKSSRRTGNVETTEDCTGLRSRNNVMLLCLSGSQRSIEVDRVAAIPIRRSMVGASNVDWTVADDCNFL
jgi:hypothetical protein